MKSRQLEIIICWGVLVLMLAGTWLMYMDGRDTKVFMGVLTIMSLSIIGLWQWKSKHPLDSILIIMTYLFTFISVGIGTFGGAYAIHHFDDFLHVTSGIWLGYAALVLGRQLIGERLAGQLPKYFWAIFMVLFALAAAGAWELLEFAGDKLFHFTAQGRDADDTMFDMMDGLIGGIISASVYLMKK